MSDDITTDPEADTPQADSPEELDQPDLVDKAKGEEPFDQDRAMAKIRKANSEAAKLRERLKQLEPLARKAQELEDASKTEVERLTGDRDTLKTRAESAEVGLAKYNAALEAAPDGATKKLIAAVAKRVTGSSPEELAADAAELYELLGSHKSPPASRPKEALRGGADPDEAPEETDPRKLADLIRRG
jgi:sulfur transfer protein SufE